MLTSSNINRILESDKISSAAQHDGMVAVMMVDRPYIERIGLINLYLFIIFFRIYYNFLVSISVSTLNI